MVEECARTIEEMSRTIRNTTRVLEEYGEVRGGAFCGRPVPAPGTRLAFSPLRRRGGSLVRFVLGLVPGMPPPGP